MGELINNPMLGLEQILFRFHNTFSVRHSRQCFNKTSINKYCLTEFHWSKFLVLKEFTLIRLDANSKRILFLSLAQMNKIMTNFDVCDLFDSNILAGETKLMTSRHCSKKGTWNNWLGFYTASTKMPMHAHKLASFALHNIILHNSFGNQREVCCPHMTAFPFFILTFTCNKLMQGISVAGQLLTPKCSWWVSKSKQLSFK